MKNVISRRVALQLLAASPAAATLLWTPAEAAQAHSHTDAARAANAPARFKPKFFTAHEYATVGVLVDLIIPRDERSGSATDAGVPEFMDFMMVDQPRRQVAMRGGLALLDRLSGQRFAKRFVESSDAQRRQLLDDIADARSAAAAGGTDSRSTTASRSATASAERPVSQAIAFFSSFRDLTATGFFTSKMGMTDLQYQGNVYAAEWNGCSETALRKLGV